MSIDAIRRAIHGRYGIQKKGPTFVLAKGIRVHVNGKSSFGFSLDSEEHPPFSFLRDSPPKHLAKMCDAIIVFESSGGLYFAVIEQKTGDPADYDKQLANGKFFCEWLMSLCREHGYTHNETITYLGVLVWEPRPIPLKGSTTHRNFQASHHRLFDKFFDLQNETDIDVDLLASSSMQP